jgi:hypothetical protein
MQRMMTLLYEPKIIKSSTHMTLFSVLPGVFVENFLLYRRGRHGHDRMVVGLPVQSVPITTKVVTSNPVRGKEVNNHNFFSSSSEFCWNTTLV